MEIKNNPPLFYLVASLIILGCLSLLSLPIIFFNPGLVQKMMGDYSMDTIVGASLAEVISALIYFLCAWGIKKQNKLAYYATWVSLVLVLLKWRILGFILIIFMVLWLIKVKNLFFKN